MPKYPINLPEIQSLLVQGRLNDVFDTLLNLAGGLSSLARYRSELQELSERYGYMSDYALRGLPDPGLADNHAAVTDALRALADRMLRMLMTADAPTLYFSILRTGSATSARSIADTIAESRRIAGRLALTALAENPAEALDQLTLRKEALERELFTAIWTTHPLADADKAAVSGMIADAAIPDDLKRLTVSALTLGLMEWQDAAKAELLMEAYATSADRATAIRALCGVLLWLWFYRERPVPKQLRLRLESLKELQGWASDVRITAMEFLRARDTERLTRKFNEEVLPEMMKLRPELEKLSRKPLDSEQIAALEENPEWTELLDKSGLSDRLREMQEMQEDGDDVMMATFSMLKTFPFFHDVPAWFLPFSIDRSVFRSLQDTGLSPVLNIISGAIGLCDSDKYSVCLSMSRVPQAQRDIVAQQFKSQTEQLEAIRAAGLHTPDKNTRNLAANYVRCLYRFFKLFRRKGEFKDPFALGLNLPVLDALSDVFDDADTLTLIGEFYFKRRYFDDAFRIFERLDGISTPSASLYQKMGYCKQALADLPEALRFYEQSEMLDPASRWTRRRLATVHRALHHYDSALRYYKSLMADRPDDVTLCINAGLCLTKLHRYEEALQFLFKADYLGSDSPKALRAIVWCTLLGGDLERARTYSDRACALPDVNATDLLNAGHLELLSSHPDKAAGLYARSIALRDFDSDGFRSDFDRDTGVVEGLRGVSPLLRNIVADRATLLAKSLGDKV